MRFELAAVDRSLVILLSLRERIQHRVLLAKADLGLPLFDPRQEAVVARRARVWAGRYGGSPELAEAAIGAAVAAGKASFARRRDGGSSATLSPELEASPRAVARELRIRSD